MQLVLLQEDECIFTIEIHDTLKQQQDKLYH